MRELKGVSIGDPLDQKPHDEIIEGEGSGVDTIARIIADLRDIPVRPFPADWCDFKSPCTKTHTHLGMKAGTARNKQMLDENPDAIWAFHDDLTQSKGTRSMITLALRAGKPVKHFSHGEPAGVILLALPRPAAGLYGSSSSYASPVPATAISGWPVLTIVDTRELRHKAKGSPRHWPGNCDC